MNFRQIFAAAALTLLTLGTSLAQTDVSGVSEVAPESEVLKIAALEALISAPPERALPLVSKVLSGNHSNEVKSRALFVLSQIELPEAQTQLLEIARSGNSELQENRLEVSQGCCAPSSRFSCSLPPTILHPRTPRHCGLSSPSNSK